MSCNGSQYWFPLLKYVLPFFSCSGHHVWDQDSRDRTICEFASIHVYTAGATCLHCTFFALRGNKIPVIAFQFCINTTMHVDNRLFISLAQWTGKHNIFVGDVISISTIIDRFAYKSGLFWFGFYTKNGICGCYILWITKTTQKITTASIISQQKNTHNISGHIIKEMLWLFCQIFTWIV